MNLILEHATSRLLVEISSTCTQGELQYAELLRRCQVSENENKRLSQEGSSRMQDLVTLRQTLEAQSAEYFRQVETLRMSLERDKELLVQAVSSTSASCPNCPMLIKRIAELQSYITHLSGKANALGVEVERLKSSLQSTASDASRRAHGQYYL